MYALKLKRWRYSRLRYVRARVKAALKSNINPINAPTPIQYQYAYGKNLRDFITSIPNDFVEFGRTFSRKTGSDVKQLLRDFEGKKKFIMANLINYMCPTLPKKLDNNYSIMYIHYR